MRAVVLSIDFSERNDHYRYLNQYKRSGLEADDYVEDFTREKPYYAWILKRENFGITKDTSIHTDEEGNEYLELTILLFESHPYFNSGLLMDTEGLEDVLPSVYEPLYVLEDWASKEYNKYKRRLRNAERKKV